MILGVMISMAWITERTRAGRLPLMGADQQQRVTTGPIDFQNEYRKLTEEVKTLRAKTTDLQNSVATRNESTKVLNDELQAVKVFAGLTEAKGPGITITLQDSPKAISGAAGPDEVIHDVDVLKVVNELWAAGAEAITVAGHRVAPNTAFRCVGPVIHVQNVPIASPIMIRAIGDPNTLKGALNMPGGVLAEIRTTDPDMIDVATVKEHHFDAFNGSTAQRWLEVPKPAK